MEQPKYLSGITKDMIPEKLKTGHHDWQFKIINSLKSQLDDILIEALKRKGFLFENPMELHEFIKLRCRCEERLDLMERIYFVDNIPFLFHSYRMGDLEWDYSNNSTKVSADYGKYSFL